jgi:hypothetical protein
MFRPRTFFRPLDAVLALLVAAAAAWGFLAFRFSEGARAVVYVGDKKQAWYELAGPKREVAVPTRIGDVRVEVGGGSIRVAASPCRNKACVRTGAVHGAHSEIICMPAHLLIVVEGEDRKSKDAGLDAVTF